MLEGLNGMSASDFRRYIVRWVTEYGEHTNWNLQVVGYCVYDTRDCISLFEHADKQVCQKVLEMMLNDEMKGNKC
jgi:hypothetical protein